MRYAEIKHWASLTEDDRKALKKKQEHSEWLSKVKKAGIGKATSIGSLKEIVRKI